MAGVQGKDVEEDGGLTRIPSTEVEYQQDTTLGDQASISGSGTQSDDWIFRRRLFLNFEVLNPKQHKVVIPLPYPSERLYIGVARSNYFLLYW